MTTGSKKASKCWRRKATEPSVYPAWPGAWALLRAAFTGISKTLRNFTMPCSSTGTSDESGWPCGKVIAPWQIRLQDDHHEDDARRAPDPRARSRPHIYGGTRQQLERDSHRDFRDLRLPLVRLDETMVMIMVT